MPGLTDELVQPQCGLHVRTQRQGALGLIINKPSTLRMQELFEKVELHLGRSDLIEIPVFQGGPVHTERGFVLHEPLSLSQPSSDVSEATYASTLTIPGGLEMTTSKDVLEALSTGAGPKRVLITLGYSAWA
jgi:putative transcriptional regulator